jgi:hypothetical protein
MPNPSFELPPVQAAASIAVRYSDANGFQSPISLLPFEPRTALQHGMRENLKRIADSWLSFGSGQNSGRAYLTNLLSYRCGIQRVELGYNGEAPREPFALPPCDAANPYLVPTGVRMAVELRPDVQSVAVRITFVGGEVSETKTFARPARR